MRFVAGLLAGAVLMAGTPAFAQLVVKGEDRVIYKPVTTLVLDGSDVTGVNKKPEITYGTSLGRRTFKSLIQARTSFQPELEKTLAKL